MSESKPWDLWEVILEETDSRWVRWEDYARLKAEVDDLRLENQAFKRTVNEASAHYDNRLADISRLKAEVERLTALVESNLNQSKLAMAKSDASVRTLEAQVERLTKAGDAMISEWASGDEKDAQNFLRA
jgi:outer membrane murein-binding lipoprotein Lpp